MARLPEVVDQPLKLCLSASAARCMGAAIATAHKAECGGSKLWGKS